MHSHWEPGPLTRRACSEPSAVGGTTERTEARGGEALRQVLKEVRQGHAESAYLAVWVKAGTGLVLHSEVPEGSRKLNRN